MAKEAKDTETEKQESEMHFDIAKDIIMQSIVPGEEAKSAKGKLVSDAKKKLKNECNLSGPASDFFIGRILASEDETQQKHLRTLRGLCKEFGIHLRADLVDMSEGVEENPVIPVAKGSAPATAH
jgi:hypothetical protein